MRILDLGTGSGAIAVTLLAELPDATAVASDLSAAALRVAKGNAEALGVAGRVSFVQANWFEGIGAEFDLIVSNPPYIPLGDIAGLAPDVREFDPPRALDGGTGRAGGLSPNCRRGWRPFGACKAMFFWRSGRGRKTRLTISLRRQGFARESRHFDLSGHVRCLVFSRP